MSRKTLSETMDGRVVERLASAAVLVVGDILLDRFVEGHVSRVSPEAPVPVLRFASSRTLLGGAGNVAANVLAFGARAHLVGLCGADEAAGELRQLCGGFGRLTADLIVDPLRPTTVKTRFLSSWHQLLRLDSEQAETCSPDMRAQLLNAVETALPSADAVVLSDYGKGVLDEIVARQVIERARRAGRPVVIDPKRVPIHAFAGATLLTPNVEEMAQLTGVHADDDPAAEAACRKLLDIAAVDAVLLTRGKDGMTLQERGRPPIHVHAAALRVFDVTGAGDTVIATVAAGLAAGTGLADAVRLANAAAGIVVAKPGTATVSPHELRRALGSASSNVVDDLRSAAERVATWKGQGLRVGFTNGCFDLLHRGHLFSLEQAARRCDRLVVGVNSDASTARLKGPGRPVQDAATRAALLGALRPVDLVVEFDEDTPAALVEQLRPDILFKGADYDGKEVVGREVVESGGGRVELLPLLPGHSTSATVQRLPRSRQDV